MMLVTDLPIWENCPYKVPPDIEVRRGQHEGQDLVVFWDSVNQLHVDIPANSLRGCLGMVLSQLNLAAGYKRSVRPEKKFKRIEE